MFTDLVGFSALVQRDENLGRQLLDRHRRLVRNCLRKHGGREVQTAGDGFLCEFASALQALRCAIAIQQAHAPDALAGSSPELRVRIGLHVADIERRGSGLFGDGVNIAARLEPLSPPAGIAVSRTFVGQLHAGEQGLFRSMGPQSLKNIASPVEVLVCDPATVLAQAPPAPESSFAEAAWLRRRSLLAACMGTLIVAGVVAWLATRMSVPAAAVTVDSRAVAVLPFVNLSSDRDNEYFTAGLHDAVLTHLARVEGAHVISRTSVLKYRDTQRNLREIGRELGAAYVVEGSVQREQGRLLVNAQLIAAASDEHLWAARYDRELSDVFTIQADLAEQIASAINAHLTPTEKARIEQVPTRDLEAYDLYLQATDFDRSSATYVWKVSDWQKAVDNLERAVARDPHFALAYAALAHVNVRMFWNAIDPSPERLERARAAAETALGLAPDAGEVRMAQGLYWYYGRNDFARAAVELEQARRLLPGDSAVYEFSGYVYRRQGRYEEAIAVLRQALRLDPYNERAMSGLVDTLTGTRRYAEADRELQRWQGFASEPAVVRVIRTENRFWWTGERVGYEDALRAAPDALDQVCWLAEKRWRTALFDARYEEAVKAIRSCAGGAIGIDAGEEAPKSVYEALALELGGRRDAALTAYQQAGRDLTRAIDERAGRCYSRIWRAYVFAAQGQSEAAREDVEKGLELARASGDRIVEQQVRRAAADFYAHAGDREHALELLRESLQSLYGALAQEVRLDPRWRSFAGDARFEEMLAAQIARDR